MIECRIYHTGMNVIVNGKIQENHVFMVGSGGALLLSQEIWCAKEECDNGLIQFEAGGKWGFADISTGEIKIKPQWDFAGPFYGQYAHVADGIQVDIPDDCNLPQLSEGGKHGYIDIHGKSVIPLVYDCAKDYPENNYYNDMPLFSVMRDGKWGLIDRQNKIAIPFLFLEIDGKTNRNFYLTVIENLKKIRYGIYNRNCEEMISPVLDEPPRQIRFSKPSEVFVNYESLTYYYVKAGRKFGVISSDGRMITNLTLSKKDAVALIHKLNGC